jgi:predicted phosphodiesterase
LEDLRKRGLQPDLVAFSGDLIYAGDSGYSEQGNDYDAVQREFIDPLLSLLDLSHDYFFICAGNHDIQRSKVSEIVEEGVSRTLVDRPSVNSLVDNLDKERAVFARMENFERFKKSINSAFVRESNVLFSTYSLEVFGIRVGIACINSAWRAYGGKDDYGRLLIGERVLDDCSDSLSDCSLRVGVVHHPFEYLQQFERLKLRKRAFGAFNIWLHGHTHEHDFELVQTFNDNRIVVIAGGTLYYNRDYYNGYSIVRYSLDNHMGKVYLREYTERGKRRRFVEAVSYGDEGIVPFCLPRAALVPLSGHHAMVGRI